jgi:hypothetical protein
MGSLFVFPTRRRDDHGCIHVWLLDDGRFEVGHESRSGDSWGNFTEYHTAEQAVAAAFALNRDEYASQCDVHVNEDVRALIGHESPPASRGER